MVVPVKVSAHLHHLEKVHLDPTSGANADHHDPREGI
jgi:hypothetical protein